MVMKPMKGKLIHPAPSEGLASQSTTTSAKEEKEPALPPTSSSGASVSMKENQVLEASKPTLAKASAVDSVREEPTTAAALKEYANVVKDLPHSLKSMNELFGLSAALSIFTLRFNELQKHMEFIDKSIDNMHKLQNGKESEVFAVVPAPNASTSCFPGAPFSLSNDQIIGSSANEETSKETSRSALETICETMGGRGLRKYITTHLSEIEKLREEAPTAIRLASSPAKLVLECIGRFYLQGSKAFTKASPMIANREASVLVLEFFLLSGCTSIEPSVKEEAEAASIAWRKRLINEGGVSNASYIDARGLLLFVASYGIPSDFGNQDLIELIRLSNAKDISNALRRSPFLIEKIPDIIQGMVKKGMCVVAVDVAYSFGVEEKFPPETILTSFLQESKEAWKRVRGESQGSPLALKEVNEKELAALKTVTKCLEDYKINPMKLARWNITAKIANLEKEISDLDRVIEERGVLKRKADVINSWNLNSQEVKHPRTSNGVSPLMHSNRMLSQEQRAFGLTDGQTFYDGGLSGQLNGYSGASSVTGPSLSSAALVHLANHGAGSFAWHGDGTLNDNSLRQSFIGTQTFPGRGLYGSPSALEPGFSGLPSASIGTRNSGADLYQFADAVLERESRAGNSYMAPSTARSRH